MQFSRLTPSSLAAVAAVSTFLLHSAPMQAAEVSAPRYRIQGLGPNPPSSNFLGYEINNTGMVVGSILAKGKVHLPYLWSNGRLQSLVLLDSGLQGSAIAINNQGDAVGALSSTDGRRRAVIYRGGEVIDLSPALSSGEGFAWGINDAGQVTANVSSDSADTRVRTFLIDKSHVQEINVPWVSRYHAVGGLNNKGSVLVSDAESQALLYRNGNSVVLGSPDAPLTVAALNDADQVAGTRNNRAFIYSDGALNFLPTLDGRPASLAVDINNDGWVIGRLGSTVTTDYWPGNFLYRDGQLYDFNSLLRPSSAALWSNLKVKAINDRGQIMGWGNYYGSFRTFVATPVPEPSTWATLLTGLGLMGWATRRRTGKV